MNNLTRIIKMGETNSFIVKQIQSLLFQHGFDRIKID